MTGPPVNQFVSGGVASFDTKYPLLATVAKRTAMSTLDNGRGDFTGKTTSSKA